MATRINNEASRQQFLVEGVDLSLHHGLVKVEVDSGGGDIDLLVPFNVFFTAERRARAMVEEINADNRKVVHACPACVCKGLPAKEH